MAGYTTGLELRGRMQASKEAGEEANRKRKARIAEDKKDAIEGVYPEAMLLAGPRAARLGTKALDKGLETLAKRQGPLTTEKIQKMWPDIAPGKMPPTKTYLDEVMGVRRPKAKSMTAASKTRRNAEHKGAAEATDNDLSDYYRGLEKAKKDIRGLGDEPNTTWRNMFKKGGSVRPGKVGTVMHEFKTGKLKSSSGQKVSNPKQAIAIAMSEAGMKKPKKFAGKEGSYVAGQSKAPTTKEMTPKDLEAMGRTEVANQEAMRKAREEAKKKAAPKRYASGGCVSSYADGGTADADPRAMAAAINPQSNPQIRKIMQRIQGEGAKLAGSIDKAGGLQAMLGRLGGAGAGAMPPGGVGRGLAAAYGAGRGAMPPGGVGRGLAGVPKVGPGAAGMYGGAGMRPPRPAVPRGGMPSEVVPPPDMPLNPPDMPLNPPVPVPGTGTGTGTGTGPGTGPVPVPGTMPPPGMTRRGGRLEDILAAMPPSARPPGYKKGGKVAAKMPKADSMGSLGMKKGGMKKFAKGGRIDGCATKGKTNCKMR